jgi:hypothetical protein
LRIGETIVPIASFEPREASFLPPLHTSKERLLGFVQTAQRILQYLTEYASQVWSNCFEIGQLVDLVKYSNRGTALPGYASLLQTSVVQFTAYI